MTCTSWRGTSLTRECDEIRFGIDWERTGQDTKPLIKMMKSHRFDFDHNIWRTRAKHLNETHKLCCINSNKPIIYLNLKRKVLAFQRKKNQEEQRNDSWLKMCKSLLPNQNKALCPLDSRYTHFFLSPDFSSEKVSRKCRQKRTFKMTDSDSEWFKICSLLESDRREFEPWRYSALCSNAGPRCKAENIERKAARACKPIDSRNSQETQTSQN